MNVPQAIRRALAVLKEDGWGKGQAHLADGRHCALGALEKAIFDEYGSGGSFMYDFTTTPAGQELYNRAVLALDAAAGDEGQGIVSLNDDEFSTFGDVRKAFMNAILLAKKGVA